MTIQEGQSYYIEQFFQRLGDDTATLAWKGALEASITNNSGNWVPWSTLFELWKSTVEGREDFVDPGDLMKSSDSLKKFVGRNPKTKPPDREMPDLLWEYSCKSRVTEMLKAVTLAGRNLINAVNNIESRLKM